MRLYLFLIFLSFSAAGCGQQPQWRFLPLTDTLLVPLGDTTACIVMHRYGPAATPFFVHLHHNEQTADSALHTYLALNGGQAMGIRNNRQRFVGFGLGQKRYLFDPNRMFTPAGIGQSLRLLSSYSPGAAGAIARLSDTLVRMLPQQVPVIAVHNNTNEAYAILWYGTGGAYSAEAKAFFYNPEMDADDFVLTTDPDLFSYLKANSINSVLQNNVTAADDGSLGYYLGKKASTYVNIEAEHGHFSVQLQLIEAVLNGLKSTAGSEPQIAY